MKFSEQNYLLCDNVGCANCNTGWFFQKTCTFYNKNTGPDISDIPLYFYKKKCARKAEFLANNIKVPTI